MLVFFQSSLSLKKWSAIVLFFSGDIINLIKNRKRMILYNSIHLLGSAVFIICQLGFYTSLTINLLSSQQKTFCYHMWSLATQENIWRTIWNEIHVQIVFILLPFIQSMETIHLTPKFKAVTKTERGQFTIHQLFTLPNSQFSSFLKAENLDIDCLSLVDFSASIFVHNDYSFKAISKGHNNQFQLPFGHIHTEPIEQQSPFRLRNFVRQISGLRINSCDL